MKQENLGLNSSPSGVIEICLIHYEEWLLLLLQGA